MRCPDLSSWRTVHAAAVICAVAMWQLGCSSGPAAPKVYEVKGTVTLGGKPVPNASVAFQPEKGPPATGMTDAQGQFTLKTGADSGAVAGLHKVAITAISGPAAMANPTPEDLAALSSKPDAAAQPKNAIPDVYGDFEKSGLTATVTEDASKNNFTFDLKG